MKETPKVRRIPAYVRNPHVMKAAIYVRVSSARVEQLRSLSNQVSAMTRCVYLMQNWTLKDVYLEVASAKTDSYRREFNRLLDDCKKKEIEVVVVKSLSRFGRDSVEVIEFHQGARQCRRYHILHGRRHRRGRRLPRVGAKHPLRHQLGGK